MSIDFRQNAKVLAAVLLISIGSRLLFAQASKDRSPLLRHYREGQKLSYHMMGVNEQWHYEIEADGIVTKDSAGVYREQYGWSHLVSDGQEVTLPASMDFRQQVTLDPRGRSILPNLRGVDPRLVGPMTDFMTFYVDLSLATKTGKLTRAGDHFYVKHGTPASWADGNSVRIGESSIDFDLTLDELNPSNNKTATLSVRHVPPRAPEIKTPTDWMRKPVADTANNWVTVQKVGNGKFLAAVGKETFEVKIFVDLTDGKILSATMDNPVETIERECTDAALTSCGDSKPHSIHRRIEMSLER